MDRGQIVRVEGPSRNEEWFGEFVDELFSVEGRTVIEVKNASGEKRTVTKDEIRDATEEEEDIYWLRTLRES
jgi:hypothetical protein